MGSCRIITASGVSAMQTAQAETIATAVAATLDVSACKAVGATSTTEPAQAVAATREEVPANTPNTTSTPGPAGMHPDLIASCSSSPYQNDEFCWDCSCEKALDSHLDTRWTTKEWQDDAWIMVEFADPVVIDTVILRWEDAYGRAYSIDVSNDGTIWTTVYAETNGNGGVDEIHFPSTTAQYIRWTGQGRGTAFGYSLWEIEIP